MLKEDDKAPDFKLPSQDGKIVKPSDFILARTCEIIIKIKEKYTST